MVNPGSFGPSRKAFLISQKPAYSAGVVGGYATDALAAIQWKYHRRFLIDLPHDEEPSEEWMASVDDEEPYPEQAVPDIKTLSEEEYACTMEALEKRQTVVAFHQVVSKLSMFVCKEHDPIYCPVSKLNDGSPTNTQRTKIWTLMTLVPITLTALCCTSSLELPSRNHDKSPLWIFGGRPSKRKSTSKQRRLQKRRTPPSQNMLRLGTSLHAICLRSFQRKRKLSGWSRQRRSTMLQCWGGRMILKETLRLSQRTIKSQLQFLFFHFCFVTNSLCRCIQGLVQFAQPILDLICEATGWKCSLIAGGPEPAHGGWLNIIRHVLILHMWY